MYAHPSRLTPLALALASLMSITACSSGESNSTPRLDDPAITPTSAVRLTVELPPRMQNLDATLEVIVTAAGESVLMNGAQDSYSAELSLPSDRSFPLFVRVQRADDDLIVASAQANISTDTSIVPFTLPPQLFSTDFDSDGDGFTNIVELERGSEPRGLSEDFDGDGIANETDLDDDNDGVFDVNDAFPLNGAESLDSDGDGIGDNQDRDDDNDFILDVDDNFPLDPNESLDLDLDGLGNSVDEDDDGDGTIDLEDPQPNNPNITGNEDSDGDGVRDLEDAFPYDPAESNDVDGDGIGDNADNDNDNNGIPDDQDNSVVNIPFSAVSPTIDGAYSWWEWSAATSADSRGNRLYIDHLLIDNLGIEDDQYNYNYSRWRALHDGEYLYVLFIIDNENLPERWSDSVNPWDDDSVELYFDVGAESATTYDSNDYQRLFRYQDDADDNQTDGFYSASGMVSNYCSSRTMARQWSHYAYYEVRVLLSSIGLQEGVPFKMDVMYNDDDTAGERDSKWAWFSPSGVDNAWQNPSTFGTAILSTNRPVVGGGD